MLEVAEMPKPVNQSTLFNKKPGQKAEQAQQGWRDSAKPQVDSSAEGSGNLSDAQLNQALLSATRNTSSIWNHGKGELGLGGPVATADGSNKQAQVSDSDMKLG